MRTLLNAALVLGTLCAPVVAFAGDAPATKPTDVKSQPAKDAPAPKTKAADTKKTDTKAADTKKTDTKAADTKKTDTKAADTTKKAP